jgi:uncharacterized membrane protein YkoI
MKIKSTICFAIVGALICTGVASAVAGDKKSKEAKLEAKAKISRTDAEKTALSKVPGGTIKEGEIEKEHGKLVWSFDITTPDSKDITEVQVDAKTGKVVSVEKETPEEQAKEKEADAKGKKDKKD